MAPSSGKAIAVGITNSKVGCGICGAALLTVFLLEGYQVRQKVEVDLQQFELFHSNFLHTERTNVLFWQARLSLSTGRSTRERSYMLHILVSWLTLLQASQRAVAYAATQLAEPGDTVHLLCVLLDTTLADDHFARRTYVCTHALS
jgi:hypothetical protein